MTGDQGGDIVVTKGFRTIVIQAKRSKSPVGNKAVQQVVAAKAMYGATETWVVTDSTFTGAARTLAAKNHVALIDGSRLSRLSEMLQASSDKISEASSSAPVQMNLATTTGRPDFTTEESGDDKELLKMLQNQEPPDSNYRVTGIVHNLTQEQLRNAGGPTWRDICEDSAVEEYLEDDQKVKNLRDKTSGC
jgi:hypothetical protein